MNSLISIITPTYNHEKYIGDCIESVLIQTYPCWEMIIIDDGSTDETGKIVAQYKDPRIKYIRQENKGIWKLGETYNKALSVARGDYIAILEGDDYWPHYKLRMQIEDFKRDDVVLSYGSTAIIQENISRITPPDKLPDEAKHNKPIGAAALAMMDSQFLTFTFPVSVMIRRSTLERIGGFQQPSCLPLVDYPTFLNLALEGYFVFHSEVLGFWRRHESSTTKNKYLQILKGVEKYINIFLEEKRNYFPKKERLAIIQSWSTFNAVRWSLLGRLFLIEKDWENAYKAFKEGLKFNCSTTRKIILKLGILLSYLHLNPENLLSRLGLGSIHDILKNHIDPIVNKDMLPIKGKAP